MAHKNKDLWKTGEDLKAGGVTPKNYSTKEPNKEGSFAKKMPEEGRSKGTWGGGYSRP